MSIYSLQGKTIATGHARQQERNKQRECCHYIGEDDPVRKHSDLLVSLFPSPPTLTVLGPKAAQGSGQAPDQICASVSHVSPENMLSIQIIQPPCRPTNPPQSFVRRMTEPKGTGSNNNNKPDYKHSLGPTWANNNTAGRTAVM